jgi:hypothetical protein
VCGDRDREGGVDPRQLLDCDRVREGVGSGAAVLLRDRNPHQPELRGPGDQLVREACFAVELLGEGRQALPGELLHSLSDQLVLGREIEVHPARRDASSAIRRTPYPVPPV